MIEKRCAVEVSPDRGGLFQLVHPGYDEGPKLVKQGEVSGPAQEQLRSFLRSLSADPDKIYTLISALGGGEYWGANCVPAGTPILMADGSEVPIEGIGEGDEVISHTGAVRKVVRTFRHFAYGLIAVRPQGQANELVTTSGHPYFAVKRQAAQELRKTIIHRRAEGSDLQQARTEFVKALRPQWVEAQDLEPKDLVFVKFQTDERVHRELGGATTAFILGVYAADGCIARRRRKDRKGQPWQDCRVIFSINGEANHIADRLVTALRQRGLSPKVTPQYQGHNVLRIDVASQKLARICREHVGKGSATKTLSPDVLAMPLGWQAVFLDAYLGRDGYAPKEGTKEYGAIRLSTASPQLATGVRILAARLGLAASIVPGKQHHTSLGAGNDIYEVRLPSGQIWGGRTNTESLIHPDGYIVCPVKTIREIEDWEGHVYNLEVEEDNSYVAQGVVVHNSNGDYFNEGGLVHIPQGWHGMSHRMQKTMGAKWEWGYPTFYNANIFQHHRNSDPKRAFGSVEFVYWDPSMKRVLLVCAFDRSRARIEGADGVIDRIENGEFPSVSMGARVPYDICSVCGDWSRITGNFRRDLAEHKKKAIRGLSVTTRDYCQHLMYERGIIYPDGRKVFMWNIHPRFFDLSVVFIGADKTSYVLAKLAGRCPLRPEKNQCRGGCRDCAFGSNRSLSL